MKKKKLKRLESACTHSSEDPVNTQEYWEKVLSESDLSMNRGRPTQTWVDRGLPTQRREETLVYVGTSTNLVGIEEEQYARKSGRVRPKPPGPQG